MITGGEMHLWRLMYVNAGVGLKMDLQYQDINITGNVGMRVGFSFFAIMPRSNFIVRFFYV